MKASSIVFTSTLFALAGGPHVPGVAHAATGPTDAQIAHIIVAANRVDIDAGKLAASRGHSADVRAFGKFMVVDHSGVNREIMALASKLKVTPEDNPTSHDLKRAGAENVAHLKTLRGAAFDKAYIDHEVAYHERVLDAVDHVLIPSARNEQLKALIIEVRPLFVAHLEHARALQAQLPH